MPALHGMYHPYDIPPDLGSYFFKIAHIGVWFEMFPVAEKHAFMRVPA
jgi:hypothetical protein